MREPRPAGSLYSQRVNDRLADLAGSGRAANIWRMWRVGRCHNGFNRQLDLMSGNTFAELVKHHRRRPNLCNWIGNSFTGNVGRGTVHRFKHRGELSFWIDIRRWRKSDRAGQRGAKIGKNVAE